MSDPSLNYYIAKGTAAARAAFTPSPATPAAGPDQSYVWYETDTGNLYAWDGAAWQAASSATAVTSLTGDVTATGPGAAAAIIAALAVTTGKIAADAVTFAKMVNIATDSLVGRDTAGTGDPENILLNVTLSMDGSGNLQRAALTGDVTASAGSNATTIANDAVTYAKIQNISTTSRVLGRKTAGAGDTEELTFSEVLDFVGSAAQGDVMYRGAATWTRLGAGTNGQYLQTQGAGANPQWATVAAGAGFDLTPNFLMAGM